MHEGPRTRDLYNDYLNLYWPNLRTNPKPVKLDLFTRSFQLQRLIQELS
jgi:hypothetical protein